MTTYDVRSRGPHPFTPSDEEDGACALCLLCALAHAGSDDNCDECGHLVQRGDECGPCLDEDESLVHGGCCPWKIAAQPECHGRRRGTRGTGTGRLAAYGR